MDLLVLSIVFVAAALLVLALYVAVNRRRLTEAQEARARLRALQTGPAGRPAILRDRHRSSMPLFDELLHGIPGIARLDALLPRADLAWSVGELLLGWALGVVLAVAVGQWGGRTVGAVAVLLAAVAPALHLRHRIRRRAARLEAQLPEAIDMIVNAIRAGFSFQAAMKFVGEEMAPPIGEEFATFYDEQRLGLDVRDALLDLQERVNTLDIKMFVTSLLIQRETGGNLGEILTGLSTLIRDRSALRDQIDTLTAEPKLTGNALAVLPLLAFAVIMVLNRPMMQPMFDTDTGRYTLIFAAGILSVGVLMIRRIARIDM